MTAIGPAWSVSALKTNAASVKRSILRNAFAGGNGRQFRRLRRSVRLLSRKRLRTQRTETSFHSVKIRGGP
jgi:hypothetical protein